MKGRNKQYEWPIPEWMPPGDITVLVGEPGIGKSHLALWVATQVGRITAPHELDAKLPLVDYWGYKSEKAEVDRRIGILTKESNFNINLSTPKNDAKILMDASHANPALNFEMALLGGGGRLNRLDPKPPLLIIDVMLSSLFGDPVDAKLVHSLVDFVQFHGCSCFIVANGCMGVSGAYGLPPIISGIVPYIWVLGHNSYKGSNMQRPSICTESELMLTCEKSRYAKRPLPRFFDYDKDGALVWQMTDADCV